MVRRYSDFVWLAETLAKRYPFRLIPPLPPKKLGASSDEQFMEERRRGLLRFINFIGHHPVLRNDETVIDFLTVQMVLRFGAAESLLNRY